MEKLSGTTPEKLKQKGQKRQQERWKEGNKFKEWSPRRQAVHRSKQKNQRQEWQ